MIEMKQEETLKDFAILQEWVLHYMKKALEAQIKTEYRTNQEEDTVIAE